MPTEASGGKATAHPPKNHLPHQAQDDGLVVLDDVLDTNVHEAARLEAREVEDVRPHLPQALFDCIHPTKDAKPDQKSQLTSFRRLGGA